MRKGTAIQPRSDTTPPRRRATPKQSGLIPIIVPLALKEAWAEEESRIPRERALLPGARTISPLRISIARPVDLWRCANATCFAFWVRTTSRSATPGQEGLDRKLPHGMCAPLRGPLTGARWHAPGPYPQPSPGMRGAGCCNPLVTSRDGLWYSMPVCFSGGEGHSGPPGVQLPCSSLEGVLRCAYCLSTLQFVSS
jgi:hypothetical protein